MNLRAYLDNLPFGGQAELAQSLGIAPAYLYQISKGIRPVPPALCLAIERATAGAVTRYDLRPDIFGPAPAADPEMPAPRDSNEEAA